MAFSGAATVVKVSDGLSRITGVSLGSGATGTIGLAGSGADVELSNLWAPYAGDLDGDDAVDLAEACQLSFVFVEDPASDSDQVSVTKQNGGDPATFTISMKNDGPGESSTAEMEIYVRFH